MTATVNASATPGTYEVLAIEALIESPKNPRQHFDQAKLAELANSLREHGVLTPLLARPARTRGKGTVAGFELAAGHRRYRAAKLAGLTQLPVVVREMDDTQFLEVLTIENLQRDDVHALEEAQGFKDLMAQASYTAERIAERIGKSVKYVYDRVKLLELTPALQQLFFEGKITTGHAILFARLSAADQTKAAEYPNGGLWQHEQNYSIDLDVPQHTTVTHGETYAYKAKSVRELQQWIDEHVRFEVAEIDPQLFPETAAVVPAAIEQQLKVVSITHDYHVHPDAKTDGERTYGPMSWKRADGKEKSKPCPSSILGVIVAGEGRGLSFAVCVDKQKCKTHWGAEIAERARRAKATTASGPAKPAARPEWQIQEEERKKAEAAWALVAPSIVAALAAHVKKAPAGGRSLLAGFLINDQRIEKKAAALVSRGTSAEDLIRFLVFNTLYLSACRSYNGGVHFKQEAKAIGFDVAKIIKAATPAPETKKPPAKKKARR